MRLFCIVAALFLTACDGPPRNGGRLVLAISGLPRTLSPLFYTGTAEADIISNVADTLIAYTLDQRALVPRLAARWSESPDGSSYTFVLRPRVVFSDGRPLTSRDVRYSLECSAQESLLGRLSMLDRVEVIDDATLVCHLKAPNAAFLTALTDQGNVILPDGETRLIGTGPFTVAEGMLAGDVDVDPNIVQGTSVFLRRNSRFRGPRPHLAEIEYRYMNDNAAMLKALQDNEIHIAGDLYDDNVRLAREDRSIVYRDIAGLAVSYFYFNQRAGPTADPRVRRALIQSVDINGMNRYLYRNGEGERAFLPLPAASWGYDPTLENLIPPYDPLAAKLALIDAGYPDGFDTRIYVTNAPVRVAAAQALGRYWKEHLNVSAEVVVSEWGDFSAAVTRGDLPVYGMSWNWNSDPYFFLDNLFHSQAQNPLGNGAGFSSPTVDSFLDQAVTTSDQTARAAFYRNALTAIVAQDPLLVYATEKSTYAFSKKVHGFVLRPDRLNTFCTNEVNVWLAK